MTRDAVAVAGPRDPARLRRYLEALAVNTAGVVEDKTLYDAVGLERRTAIAYDQLLRNLLILDAVPAWSSDRLTRLIRTPKRYLVDTFAAAQIRPELAAARSRPRWYHLRDKGGRHEIDLVIEYGGGRVAGLEIKARATPTSHDARHLEWLRDTLGERFVCGVVLHTGPRASRLSERVFAAPISTLWA